MLELQGMKITGK